jgi:hypothetical protein
MDNEKPKESAFDVDCLRPAWLDFMPNIHKRYTLYYDETNNTRRLALTGTGLNHEALDCFVLGGIALHWSRGRCFLTSRLSGRNCAFSRWRRR